jgi:hypothetical protein
MLSQVMKNFAMPAPSHLTVSENFTIINAIGVNFSNSFIYIVA